MRKVTSIILSVAMVISMFPSNIVTAMDPETKKFTHNEWKGTSYTDLEGTTVKGADVYGINRKEATATSTTSVSFHSIESAISGARDYAKDDSNYVQFLTGDSEGNWSLAVVQNQTIADKSPYTDFFSTDYNPSGNWKNDLVLPASWQYHGFDFPIYANVIMPWQSSYDSYVACPKAPRSEERRVG